MLAPASDAITRTAEGEDALRRALSQLRLKGRLALPGGGDLPPGVSAPSGATGQARVAYSPNGARLAISVPTAAAVFDLAEPDAPPTMLQLPDGAGAITDIAFSPDGTRVATAHGNSIVDAPDHTARIWMRAAGRF